MHHNDFSSFAHQTTDTSSNMNHHDYSSHNHIESSSNNYAYNDSNQTQHHAQTSNSPPNTTHHQTVDQPASREDKTNPHHHQHGTHAENCPKLENTQSATPFLFYCLPNQANLNKTNAQLEGQTISKSTPQVTPALKTNPKVGLKVSNHFFRPSTLPKPPVIHFNQNLSHLFIEYRALVLRLRPSVRLYTIEDFLEAYRKNNARFIMKLVMRLADELFNMGKRNETMILLNSAKADPIARISYGFLGNKTGENELDNKLYAVENARYNLFY